MESNRVLVLQDIIAAMTAETGTSEALCRSFVSEMFALVAERLIEGEAVEIKGVGRFDVVDGVVRFAADGDVAAAINSAFDCFEAIELADDYDGESEKEEEEPAAAEEEPVAEEPVAEEEVAAEEEPTEEAPAEQVDEEQEPEMSEEEPETTEEPEETEEPEMTDDAEETEEYAEPRRRGRFGWGFLSGFLTAAVLAVVAYLFVPGLQKSTIVVAVDSDDDSTTAVVDTATAVDTAAEVTDVATDEPAAKTDPEAAKAEAKDKVFKVTNTAYLSNISRKFYGHYAFWVYIYLENKDIIKDPDNLPVGAELRIPAPEKYGINKDDPESVRRAEVKALEVKNGK